MRCCSAPRPRCATRLRRADAVHRPAGGPRRAGGRPAGGRPPAAGDPEGAVPRRADPDPGRAHRGADAAGDASRCSRCWRRLAAQGTTILLITHKLKEVMRLCDARHGHARRPRGARDATWTAARWRRWPTAMVGRKVAMGRQSRSAVRRRRKLLLDAAGLRCRDALGVTRLHGVGLQLRAGEIVGLAGVSGNGQSELLELLSGLRRPDAGTLRVGDAGFDAGALARPAHRAHAGPGACARRPARTRPGDGLRRLGIGRAGLRGRGRGQPPRLDAQRRAAPGHGAADGALRRAPARRRRCPAPASPAATSKSWCWRAN